jgi:hypothetical protein
MFMNNEQVSIWKETATIYMKVLSQYAYTLGENDESPLPPKKKHVKIDGSLADSRL